jgi:hypothetical protein
MAESVGAVWDWKIMFPGSLQDVWTYDVDSGLWAQMAGPGLTDYTVPTMGVDTATMPIGRGLSILAVLNNGTMAYLYGGADGSQAAFGDLWKFDLTRLNYSGVNINTLSTVTTGDSTFIQSSSNSSNTTTLAIAVAVPVFVVIAALVVAFLLWRRRRQR